MIRAIVVTLLALLALATPASAQQLTHVGTAADGTLLFEDEVGNKYAQKRGLAVAPITVGPKSNELWPSAIPFVLGNGQDSNNSIVKTRPVKTNPTATSSPGDANGIEHGSGNGRGAGTGGGRGLGGVAAKPKSLAATASKVAKAPPPPNNNNGKVRHEFTQGRISELESELSEMKAELATQREAMVLLLERIQKGQ